MIASREVISAKDISLTVVFVSFHVLIIILIISEATLWVREAILLWSSQNLNDEEFYPLISANSHEFFKISRRLARIGGLVFDFEKAMAILWINLDITG